MGINGDGERVVWRTRRWYGRGRCYRRLSVLSVSMSMTLCSLHWEEYSFFFWVGGAVIEESSKTCRAASGGW